jgi:hypothetical protein
MRSCYIRKVFLSYRENWEADHTIARMLSPGKCLQHYDNWKTKMTGTSCPVGNEGQRSSLIIFNSIFIFRDTPQIKHIIAPASPNPGTFSSMPLQLLLNAN